METQILCGCGHGPKTHYAPGLDDRPRMHVVEEGTCCRKIATGNLVPTNFRTENGVEVCDVNGYTITQYTLRYQRSYANKGDVWTLPKSEDSTNSLEGNW